MVLPRYDEIPGISIFGFRIAYYGILYCIGYIVAEKCLPFPRDINVNKFFNFSIIGMIIGGRLGYYLFYNLNMTFYEILLIRSGGMSFHGGLIGVIISMVVFSIVEKKDFFIVSSDVASISAPVIIFFVRIGNFINQEIVGKTSRYGVIFQNYDNNIRIPIQLIESLLEGIMILILNLKYKNNRTSRFLILYSVSRILCDFLKEEDGYTGQILTIPMLVLGMVLRYMKL